MSRELLRIVPVEDLIVTGDRRHDQSLDPGLISSIREHGILQPLVVEPDGLGRYVVLAGRRRLRHAKAANLSTLPVMVRGAEDDLARLMVEAEENAHREDWTPIELGDLAAELTEEHGWTQGEVASWLTRLLGRHVSQSQVSQYVKLLDLTPLAKAAVAQGLLSFSAARELSRLNGEPELQEQLVAEIRSELERGAELTTRAMRHRVDRLLTSPEIHAEEREEAAAATAERVYEEAISHQPSVVSDAETAVRGQLSAVRGQLSAVSKEQTEGDLLTEMYLDLAREAFLYLVEAEDLEAHEEMTEEVSRLVQRFSERVNGPA